jgi:hypothetical protein
MLLPFQVSVFSLQVLKVAPPEVLLKFALLAFDRIVARFLA